MQDNRESVWLDLFGGRVQNEMVSVSLENRGQLNRFLPRQSPSGSERLALVF